MTHTTPDGAPITQNPEAQNPEAPKTTPGGVPIDANGVPSGTGIQLESPIISPTTFDNRQHVQPIPDPQPIASAPAPKPTIAPMKKDNSKILTTLSVFLGVVALVGIILGIAGLFAASSADDKLELSEMKLKQAEAIIAQIEAETGKEIATIDDVPTFSTSTGYLYVNDWGLKVKLSSELERMSYLFDSDGGYHSRLCISGLPKNSVNTFPAFADMTQNSSGLGCLVRVDTNEGTVDANKVSFGELVYTSGQYNYFYQAPSSTYSTDPSEQALEQSAVSTIKSMLASDNISSFK